MQILSKAITKIPKKVSIYFILLYSCNNIEKSYMQKNPLLHANVLKTNHFIEEKEDFEPNNYTSFINKNISLLDKITNLKKLRTEIFTDWEKDQKVLYIPPEGSLEYRDSSAKQFDLKKEIFRLLDQKGDDKDEEPWKVLALLGNSGSGKTTFTRNFEVDLWKHWKNKSDYLPLWIHLPSLKDYCTKAIEETLSDYGFGEADIKILKKNYRFLHILDSYDELNILDNLYESNKLHKWKGRVIVVCRAHHFVSPECKTLMQDCFYPKYQGQINHYLGKKIFISPFNLKQKQKFIEGYIKKANKLSNYDKKTIVWKSTKKYEETIYKIKGLDEIISSPLILRMVIQILPLLNKRKLRKVGINKIYETFFEEWYNREIKKYELLKKSEISQIEKNKLRQKVNCLSKMAANYLHKKKKNKILITNEKLKELVKSMNEEKEIDKITQEWLVHSMPLKIVIKKENEHRYSFIHKSMQDFYSFRAEIEGIDSKFNLNQLKLKNIIEILNTIILKKGTIDFRVENVGKEKKYEENLFKIVYMSRKNNQIKTAAANAITILNFAGLSFAEMDLSNIQIPGADLSNGFLSHTNLSYADLTDVTFRQAYLKGANFNGANMEGVDFGEYPYFRNKSGVTYASWAPDNKRVAYSSLDGRITVWNSNTREIIFKCRGHKNWVTNLDWSPSGNKIASTSKDTTIKIWDGENGKLLFDFTKHKKRVNHVKWNPKKNLIATCSDDGTLIIWHLDNGEIITKLDFNNIFLLNKFKTDYKSIMVSCCSWHPLGVKLIIAANEKLFLWDIKKKKMTLLKTWDRNFINHICYNPKNEEIIVTNGNKISLFPFTKNYKIDRNKEFDNQSEILNINWDAEGERIVSVNKNSTIIVWNVNTGKSLTNFLGHTDNIMNAEWDSEGRKLISASLDKTIRIWNTQISRYFTSFDVEALSNNESFVNISWNPYKPNIIATKFKSEDYILLWNIKYNTFEEKEIGYGIPIIWDNKGNIKIIKELKYKQCDTKTQKNIYIIANKTTVIASTLKGKKISEFIPKHSKAINSISLDPKGKYLATCGQSKGKREANKDNKESQEDEKVDNDNNNDEEITIKDPIKIWDISKGKLSYKISNNDNQINSVSWNPIYNKIASGGSEYFIRVWHGKNGKLLKSFNINTTVDSICWDPTGKKIAAGCGDNKIRIIDAKTGFLLRFLGTGIGSHGLILANANFEKIKGLSKENELLLNQHKITTQKKFKIFK